MYDGHLEEMRTRNILQKPHTLYSLYEEVLCIVLNIIDPIKHSLLPNSDMSKSLEVLFSIAWRHCL